MDVGECGERHAGGGEDDGASRDPGAGELRTQRWRRLSIERLEPRTLLATLAFHTSDTVADRFLDKHAAAMAIRIPASADPG